MLVGRESRAGDFSVEATVSPQAEMTGGYVRNDGFTDPVLAPNDLNVGDQVTKVVCVDDLPVELLVLVNDLGPGQSRDSVGRDSQFLYGCAEGKVCRHGSSGATPIKI